MGYLLFDLETELLEGPLDLDRRVPRVTVGATLDDAGALRLWYDRDPAGQPTGLPLSTADARALVAYLVERAEGGQTIVSWNGAGFDFRVLSHGSGWREACAKLAWEHVDLMFWLHCSRGFSVGLDKAARAVGTGKTPGIDGAEAARLWAAGAHDQVLAYVEQDVRALGEVYREALRSRGLSWVTGQGRVTRAEGALCSVRSAYALALPDTSWMRRAPWPREKFVGWMLP